MKTYLVTGGAGFIGSNFIHYMLKKYSDIKIINVDKLTYAGNLENLKEIENHENYKFIRADICDKNAIENIYRILHKSPEDFCLTQCIDCISITIN